MYALSTFFEFFENSARWRKSKIEDEKFKKTTEQKRATWENVKFEKLATRQRNSQTRHHIRLSKKKIVAWLTCIKALFNQSQRNDNARELDLSCREQ